MSDSLYGRLRELAESGLYSFHMPGHKRHFTDNDLMDWYSMDISEISGFDNLSFPEDILLSAQRKAAAFYQADETFYLINGSTAGILSAVSALGIKENQKLLISRNSHYSVYHAAYLNRISLVYIYPRDDENGISKGITALEVAEKLENNPDIGAILITSPTYEGVISDIAGIAKVAHKHNISLVVDQAHGAHFGFHPLFPENAVKQGADMVIHSLHKTLPALTQTALLHVCGNRVNRDKLKRFLRIFQSSSPSYPLMAGIEQCLELVKKDGFQRFENMLKMKSELIDQLSQLMHFNPANQIDDPCKLVIIVKNNSFLKSKNIPLNGKHLKEILNKEYLLEMEMAADNYIVAIITIMDKPEGIKRLVDALLEIDSDIIVKHNEVQSCEFYSYEPKIMMPIHEALDGEVTEVPIDAACGHIAAEFVTLYPPARPLLVPGEIIDSHIVKLLLNYQSGGFSITGLNENGNLIVNKEMAIGYQCKSS